MPLTWKKTAITSALLFSTSAIAVTMNGFTIEGDALIPVDEIHGGGPARDGIPAITRPRFIPADQATELKADDWVLGISWNGSTRAYPISIMNYHEIVNDRFGDEPVVVTFCPLCGSGIAYSAQVKGMEMSFGVSGLLYNSDVLLYDHQTDSLWSQMLSKAISGPLKGSRLEMLPLTQTRWSAWRADHPDTQVLSRDTGFTRNYDRDPYSGYQDSSGVWFPVKTKDPRYHPKERVMGVQLDGKFKAYPMSELNRTKGEVKDRFVGRTLTIKFDATGGNAQVYSDAGTEIPSVTSYWFAWYAFHPDTEVFQVE